jgi:hypothetical protein
MTYVEKDPVIREAQILTEKYAPWIGCDGCMILFWKDGKANGGVSYGKTKKLCREYGAKMDVLVGAAPPDGSGG